MTAMPPTGQPAPVSFRFPSRRRWLDRAVSAIVALALVLGLAGCGDAQLEDAMADALSQAATEMAPTVAATPARPLATATRRAPQATRTPKAARATPTLLPERIDGIPAVPLGKLPGEVRKTLALIEQGGPYPYRQDGAVFQNREGVLPRKARGYYHEYTVVTPRSRDRGARRIVTGDKGEIYYTGDHYETFVRVLMP